MGLSISNLKDKTIIRISGSFVKKSDENGNEVPHTFEEIEIAKNDILLDLKDVKLLPSDDTLANKDSIELFKLRIDFGDGKSELHSKIIKSKFSTIYKETTDWNEVSHYIDAEEDIKKSEIVITLYNTFGDAVKLVIPYILKSNSLSMIGTEFDLISANVRNDNKVSFVLRHRATDSIISVYGNGENATIQSGNIIQDA